MSRSDYIDVRFAVLHAMQTWPNGHLGEESRRDDLRRAFRFLRSRVDRGMPLKQATIELDIDAYRYEDM